jgi:hypothetical protein
LHPRAKTVFTTAVFAIGWIAAIGCGLRALLAYESTPGPVGVVPQVWPDSQIPRPTGRPTLVMWAHPFCPCTRASIGELAQIMARIQGKVSTYVLFFRPTGSGTDWDDTELRRAAAAIPGVKVLTDLDGIEARRFGAETSGHTILFDANGRLLFSGGITESRGHSGTSTGENAVISLINNQRAKDRSPVFGCLLSKRESACPISKPLR